MPAGTGVWVVKTVERAADLERGVEVEARAALGDRELADPLEAEEAGVALVGVEHLGLGRAGDPGVGAQRADAADAEQHLLAQPVLAGAAVQPVGDVAEVVGVLLDVGVEQQQRHPADAGRPRSGRRARRRRACAIRTSAREPSASRSSESGSPSGSRTG